MIVKFVEVYETTQAHSNASNRSYSLREVYINPEHVVCVREDPTLKERLNEGLLPSNLDARQDFTRIYLDRGHAGLDVIVVGNPAMVKEKIVKSGKQMLKG